MKLFTYLKLQNLFILIFMLGIVFNSIAVLKNDCRMPVLASYKYVSDNHFTFLEREGINFYPLTDIFYAFGFHFSIGDVCLTIGGLGLGWVLFYQAKQYRRLKRGEIWLE